MRTKISLFAVLAGILPWTSLADGPTYAQYSLTRTAGDAAGNDEFGVAIAMEGDTLVVGAHFNDDTAGNSGSAYVFRRDQGSADNWGQAKELNASDPGNADEFGFSVDVDGDFVIVGAPYDDDQGNASGSAYVFARNSPSANQWGQVAKLTNTTGAVGDEFGFDVAIDGDTAVVGAPHDGNEGAVHVFLRNEGGADNWGQATTVIASDGASNDQFGHAVDFDGDIIVVGAPLDDTPGSAGSIYLFQGGGSTWSQLHKRRASDASSSSGDQFGYVVALQGDRLIVGAPFDGSNVGSAYIFEKTQGGTSNWGQKKKLVASDSASNDQFGFAVAIQGTVAMVGAHEDGGAANSGSAYFFDRNAGGTGNWGESDKVVGNNGSNNDETGYAVALVSDTAAAGAPFEDLAGSNAGAVYLYNLTFNQDPVINNQTFSIAENSPNTTIVGTVVATASDGGQTLGFQITNDPSNGAFSLHPTTGVLTVLDSTKLDFETTQQFILTVQVTDNGTPPLSDTAAITIDITDVAEDFEVDLIVTKTGPATAVAGTAISYTLIVSNAGPLTATSVVLTDDRPTGVTPSGPINFNIGTLVAGAASSVNVPVTINSGTTGTLINNASATNDVTDLNPANNADSASTTVSVEANLGVNMIAPTGVVAGTALDLTIQVSNAGPSDAPAVVATTTLPPGVLPTGAIVTNLGTLAAGGSTSFVVSVAVDADVLGDLTNLVSVTSSATDPTPANNSDSEVVNVTAKADLLVLKTAPATVFNGDPLQYTITVANLGPSLARDIVGQDSLPSFGVTPSGTVPLLLDDLWPGAATNVTIDVTVTGFGGVLVNSVGVGSTTFDPNGTNNVDTASTQIIGPADLRTIKSAAPELSDGSNLVYTIVVDNIGAGIATNTTLVDTLPAGVTFDPGGSDPGCTESNNVITCPIGTLGLSEAATVTVAVVVSTNTTGAITNSAVASTLAPEVVLANNTGTAVTDVTDFDGDLDPDFHDPDDDNDIMPDEWELQHGLNRTNAADALTNADTDTFSNLEEYIADTNPTNGLSFFKIDRFESPPPAIGFESSTGRLYTIEWTPDLPAGSWTSVLGAVDFPGVGGMHSSTNLLIGPNANFRLKVRLP